MCGHAPLSPSYFYIICIYMWTVICELFINHHVCNLLWQIKLLCLSVCLSVCLSYIIMYSPKAYLANCEWNYCKQQIAEVNHLRHYECCASKMWISIIWNMKKYNPTCLYHYIQNIAYNCIHIIIHITSLEKNITWDLWKLDTTSRTTT